MRLIPPSLRENLFPMHVAAPSSGVVTQVEASPFVVAAERFALGTVANHRQLSLHTTRLLAEEVPWPSLRERGRGRDTDHPLSRVGVLWRGVLDGALVNKTGDLHGNILLGVGRRAAESRWSDPPRPVGRLWLFSVLSENRDAECTVTDYSLPTSFQRKQWVGSCLWYSVWACSNSSTRELPNRC